MTKVKKQNKMGKIDSCDKKTKSFLLEGKRKEEKIKEDVYLVFSYKVPVFWVITMFCLCHKCQFYYSREREKSQRNFSDKSHLKILAFLDKTAKCG